jgi:hypothetical protein
MGARFAEDRERPRVRAASWLSSRDRDLSNLAITPPECLARQFAPSIRVSRRQQSPACGDTHSIGQGIASEGGPRTSSRAHLTPHVIVPQRFSITYITIEMRNVQKASTRSRPVAVCIQPVWI